MAPTKNSLDSNGQPESVQGYFRRIFQENPHLLKGKSNQALLDRWLADHPGEIVTGKIRQGLSNAKSQIRSKGRKRRARRDAAAVAAGTQAPKLASKKSALANLEGTIDEGLTQARNLDREGLEDVIALLRRARNLVVWKMGQ